MPLNMLFFGTSSFAVPVLQKLIDKGYKITVITQPDKPIGRKQILSSPPVKQLAGKYNLSIFQPENLLTSDFRLLTFDLIVTASYGKIIPKEILKLPKHGALNVHPSLLPKYRGASPIQEAILNGESETGVTIMLMDEKMDHGPILSQKKILLKNKKYLDLHNELSFIGADLLLAVIPDWIAEKIKPVPQNDLLATYTKVIAKENGKIDWNKSAEEIERQIRALNPWPGSWALLKNKRIKITDAAAMPSDQAPHADPGKTIKTPNKKLAVICGQGSLEILEIQMEGKKAMTGELFLNGHPEILTSGFET